MLTEGDHDKMRGFAPEPPERMTDERLAELERKFHDNNRRINEDTGIPVCINPDIMQLLQALKAERAEIEGLRGRKEFWKDEATCLRDDLTATNSRLLAAEQEVERLREQLAGDSLNREIHKLSDRIKALRHIATSANQRAEAAESRLARLLDVVIGWREYDWPAWFCRRTAEAIADRVRETQALIEEARDE